MSTTGASTQLGVEALAAALRAGQGFTELTGLAAPQPDEDEARLAGQRAYRQLVRQCHPDLLPPPERALGSEVLALLVAAWEQWEQGGRDPVVLRTRAARYEVGASLWESEVCVSFGTQLEDAQGRREVELRLPHAPSSNDLMVAEARALRRLAAEVPEQSAYFPELLEQIRHRDETGVERRANVVERPSGLYSLAEVRAAYPRGVHPKDAAWMWRRALVALGAAHRAGLVHASPWLEHIWVEPREHGVVLDGWWYAAAEGEPLVAAVTARSSQYPEGMLVERAAGPGEDLYILARSMEELMGPQISPPLRGFVRGCTLPPSQRPQDAWELLRELDELLERMWGKRRFREFRMPEVGP